MHVIKVIKGRRIVYARISYRRKGRVRTILKYVGLADYDKGGNPWS